MRPPKWTVDAACIGSKPELWFPPVGAIGHEALKICAVCPVRQVCAEYALTAPRDPDGIWGGLTPNQRRELRQRGRTARSAPTRKTSCGTVAGSASHYRAGEKPCELCAIARREYDTAATRARRAKLKGATA